VMTALFDPSGSILDGLPPHVWQGPTACQDWDRQAMEAGEREGAAGYFFSLGEPRHVGIASDYAYVAPATMAFTVHGQAVTQSSAAYTVGLRKLATGWRIRAWAWEGAQAGNAVRLRAICGERARNRVSDAVEATLPPRPTTAPSFLAKCRMG
jgi:hypothetical protein